MEGHNTPLRLTTTPARALLWCDFHALFYPHLFLTIAIDALYCIIARRLTTAVLPAPTRRAPILATAQSVKPVAVRRF